jgi:DNA uptake protein ComE-like DNA-binding protein
VAGTIVASCRFKPASGRRRSGAAPTQFVNEDKTMRHVSDTTRLVGLVGGVVTAGLVVAAFANGSADALGRATVSKASFARPVAQPAETDASSSRKVRVVYSGPLVAAASAGDERTPRQIERAVPSPVAAAPAPRRERGEVDATGSVAPASAAAATIRVAALDSAPAQAPARVTGAEAAAKSGLDLNSASIDELNAMGGGRIGKAIARARPYTSPEDLLRKRVVNRATYARIKDQVTAQ